MDYIKMIAQIPSGMDEEQASDAARYYDNCGADELYYYDEASFAKDGEEDIKMMQAICRSADIPLNVCARVKRFEDIKKMVYAGAKRVFIREERDNLDAVKEASERFGAERIFLCLDMDASVGTQGSAEEACLLRARKAVEEEGFGGMVLVGNHKDSSYVQTADYLKVKLDIPIFIMAPTADADTAADMLRMCMPAGIIMDTAGETADFMELKQYLKGQKLPVNTFETAIAFADFKLNSDGMVPVITQDYKTGEVLMLAYMTKEAFEKTIATGKMTYFSRSRQELWTKGDTSGHYQYVKSLTLDCDNDTILAKVAQIGAACHTGNRTCFFKELVRKEYDDRNPLAVFEDVFATILDRKKHPKEGSYTNYLFDKGVDKILKKVGEEATEIVIAAKNPDAEELKYEICDFLYHMMVLMADRGVTWKEITDELAQRH